MGCPLFAADGSRLYQHWFPSWPVEENKEVWGGGYSSIYEKLVKLVNLCSNISKTSKTSKTKKLVKRLEDVLS